MADIGLTSLFGIESATPDTYTNVADVIAITPPAMTREAVETTTLAAPNGYKTFIAGLKELGEASFTLNFTPSATDTLVTAFEAETGSYQITFPNGVRLQFDGFFTAYTMPELTPGGKMEATVTIKATGEPTLLAAA